MITCVKKSFFFKNLHYRNFGATGGLFQQQLKYLKKKKFGEKNDFSPIFAMLKLPWQWRRNPDFRVKKLLKKIYFFSFLILKKIFKNKMK